MELSCTVSNLLFKLTPSLHVSSCLIAYHWSSEHLEVLQMVARQNDFTLSSTVLYSLTLLNYICLLIKFYVKGCTHEPTASHHLQFSSLCFLTFCNFTVLVTLKVLISVDSSHNRQRFSINTKLNPIIFYLPRNSWQINRVAVYLLNI